MKKAFTFSAIITILLVLTACTLRDSRDTYFIHAVGFEKDGNLFRICAVCEKLQDKKEDYFTVSRQGKSIEDATKKLMEDFKDCYFATAEIYVIPKESDGDFITDIAKEICDSNVYPTKSYILQTDENIQFFMNQIKNEEILKRIDKITKSTKTNAAAFFSHVISGKEKSVPTLSVDNGGKLYLNADKDKSNKEVNNEKINKQ